MTYKLGEAEGSSPRGTRRRGTGGHKIVALIGSYCLPCFEHSNPNSMEYVPAGYFEPEVRKLRASHPMIQIRCKRCAVNLKKGQPASYVALVQRLKREAEEAKKIEQKKKKAKV